MNQEQNRRIHSFVRRGGRLTETRIRAYEQLMPHWGVPFQKALLDWDELFPGTAGVVLEIGFGMGEATREIARNRTDTGFLAVEVHHPGVAKMLAEIESQCLENIRVIEHDAVEVLESMIPDESLQGVHIFFPDPWPKKRHHKRRLIQSSFVELLCKKIEVGGYIYTATDWADYSRQMLEVMSSVEVLENPFEGFAHDIDWRPRTRFEKKGREKNYPIREVFMRKKGVTHG